MNGILNKLQVLVLALLLAGCARAGTGTGETYTNPILPHGQDPWMVKYAGNYYYCCARGNGIAVSVSDRPEVINPPQTVWKAPAEGWNRSCIWAPELHRWQGRWYILYAAGYSGPPYIHQKTGVLESAEDNPFGPYTDKGMVYTGDDPTREKDNCWAIDMTLFEHRGSLYAVWSGWEKPADTDKTQQNLYIARMENPWTPASQRVCISSPDAEYELNGHLPINEGPTALRSDKQLLIVYSCGQSWLDTYKLAWLRLKSPDADPLDATSWEKSPRPVFTGDNTKGVFGVGHASFITSPDDSEHYIVYHAKTSADPGWKRDIRIQRFVFDKQGLPVFGTPAGTGEPLPVPAGTPATTEAQLPGNPLPIPFGDPFILTADDGYYYLYGTTTSISGFEAHRSKDLARWESLGTVYQGARPESWDIARFWAPEVYFYDGRYYLFYSADWRENPTDEEENFRIGIAVADSPAGPFEDYLGRPLFDPGYPVIDANFFTDRDGRNYLYYSRCCYKHPVESEIAERARAEGKFREIEESWVYGVELSRDLKHTVGEPVLLLRPPVTLDDRQSEWESRSVTSGEVNRRWTEGSVTFRRGDTYYMMYSANFFGGRHYAVGYATAKHPLGPYVKSEANPILEQNTASGGSVTGTGHNNIFFSHDGGTMYCVYHARTARTGEKRMVFIDRMKITPDGQLHVEGPTTRD